MSQSPLTPATLGSPRAEEVVAALPLAAFVCLAPDGRLHVWNRRAASVWGRDPDERDPDVRFCGSLRLFRPDGTALPHDRSPTALVLRSGQPQTEILDVERPDGSRTLIRMSAAPLHAAAGAVTGVVATMAELDGTEEALTARALSEARYREIVEGQIDLVCRFLPDGTLTFANEAYRVYFGLDRAKAFEQRYVPVVHPDDLARVQALVSSMSPANPTMLIENRVFRADGAVRWTQWTNRALYDEQGRLLEFQSAGRDITERKQAEEDAARLAAIVTSAQSAIFSMTLDGVITSWNRAAERIFGFTADEAVGRSNRLIIPVDLVDEGADILARLQRGETIEHLETERAAKDGHRVPVSLTVSPLLDPTGRVIGISKIARDITERKQAERELQERESRFRLMADHAPVFIWMTDTEKRGIYFNKPWLDFTGVPLAAQVGDGWLALIHPDDRQDADAFCRQHVERRLPFTMEFRLRHVSGEYRWVQDRGRPLFLPDGTFNGYIGSCVDIHERKTAEDRIRRILEGISDAFRAVDRDWRFTYVNDHYTRMAGRPREELLGRVWWDVLSEAERDVLHDAAHRAAADQQPTRVEGYDASRDLWFESRLYPTPEGLITFTTDISDRKRLEAAREEAVARESEARAAAEEASRLKDEFLAVVSHELRTPLNAMLGWTRLLREGGLEPEAVPKALETIERNARMQAQVVEDLLDVSRIVSGKLSLDVEALRLAPVLLGAVEAVRPAATVKMITLTVDHGEPVLTVAGDAGRLHQAFSNLLTNAVKFTPSGGRIDVQLRRDGSEAVVAVRDTGIGIAPEVLPSIFDRFRQADSGTTRAHGGLGLGLTIVAYVAEALGGRVRATSPGPGQGAPFELRLPMRPDVAASAPRAPAAEPPDLRERRFLIVDDERDARDSIRAVLEQCGGVVSTAASVEEALAILRANPPDVLVGDLGMPGQDGYDLIRLVRGMPGFERLPAIALTAYADQPHRDAALRAGYDVYLCKPFDPQMIYGAILEVCRADPASAPPPLP